MIAYIVQAKSIIDPSESCIMVGSEPVALLDIYERCEVLLNAPNASGYDPAVVTETLRRRLAKYQASDALILSGAPYAIMVAGVYASFYGGGEFTALEWDRRARGSAGAYRTRKFSFQKRFSKGTDSDENESNPFS